MKNEVPLSNEEAIELIVSKDISSSEFSSSDEATSKKRKLDEQPQAGEESDYDSQDWEDVEVGSSILASSNPSAHVAVKYIDQEKKRKSRLDQLQRLRRQRNRVHYLSIICYFAHGYTRNQWINDISIQKRLKKLLPDKLRKRIKNFHHQKDPGELIYIIKYLLKWFRFNYQCNSNGIRATIPGSIGGVFVATTKEEFAKCAKKLSGNRDVGAQLFTCLLKSLGWDARLVFSLPIPRHSKSKERLEQRSNFDSDLLFPYFWTELINPLDESQIFVLEPLVFVSEDQHMMKLDRFEVLMCDYYFPNGPFNKLAMDYVVAFDKQGTIDVSSRYMKNLGYRYHQKYNLNSETVRRFLFYKTLVDKHLMSTSPSLSQELGSLKQLGLSRNEIPTSFTAFSRNLNYVIPSLLSSNEYVDEQTVPVSHFKNKRIKEPVYSKDKVVRCKSSLQWKLLGRYVLRDSLPRLIVNAKPKTLHKRRLYNYNQLNGLEDLNQQELYSYNQTELYKVETKEGKIIRNQYGDVEIFQNWMVPSNCVWLKMRRIVEIVEEYTHQHPIEHSSVICGFDFKQTSGKAIPVKLGVLILKSDELEVKRYWLKRIGEIQQQELIERQLNALKNWKNLLTRVAIKSRLDQYDQGDEQ